MSARNNNQAINAAKPATFSRPVAGFSWGLTQTGIVATGLAGGAALGATYSTAVTDLY